jgi:hypothetical protein
MFRLNRMREMEREQDMAVSNLLGEVTFTFTAEEEETFTTHVFQHLTLPSESTGTYPSAETLSLSEGDECLSEEEERDVEKAVAEIERGEAETFDNVEDALKWLKE